MSEFNDDKVYPPCVRSGFCCKQRPCPYGDTKSDTDLSCRFLDVDHEIVPGVPIHRCGRFDWIMQNVPERDWRMSPAFGGGCSSTLFNTDRDRIIALNNGSTASIDVARADAALHQAKK